MYATDRDALFCDLAETYGIFDLRALPATTLAVLACGLSDDSRIKRKMSGIETRSDILLLASAVDRLSILVWMQSKDAQHGRNRPPSITRQLLRGSEEREQLFESGEAFMAAREKLMAGGGGNG